MKIRTTLMIAALALGGMACKKKKDQPSGTPAPGSGAPKPNEGKPDKPQPPKPMSGAALATVYTDCLGMINAGKLDDFKKTCLAADYKGHDMDGQEIPNADAVIGFMQSMKAAFSDFKMEPQLVIVNGRNVLAVTLMSGTHTGDLKMPGAPEIKKTDKKIGLLFFHRLALNDENKANEEWVYSDPMTMMGQLGQLPKEAGPTRAALDKGWPGAPIVVVASDNAAEKANLELFNKSTATFNAHKAADLAAMWADDGVESDQAAPADGKGKAEIDKQTKVFLAAFPDVKADFPTTYAAGDYVVGLGKGTGTHKGPLGPIKPTNKEVTIQLAEIAKIKDGKFVELWRFRSGMAMAKQMGLMGDAPKGDAPKGDAPKGAAPKGDAPKMGK